MKKVVVIGGGHGSSVILRGLKQIENIKALESITYKPLSIAIVGEVKSGKSSFLIK